MAYALLWRLEMVPGMQRACHRAWHILSAQSILESVITSDLGFSIYKNKGRADLNTQLSLKREKE